MIMHNPNNGNRVKGQKHVVPRTKWKWWPQTRASKPAKKDPDLLQQRHIKEREDSEMNRKLKLSETASVCE